MNKKILLSLGAALTLLAGCAVLTVDVDVYTGPLANTREVQAEQVISLVMGAKPLLVQLRDHLEVTSDTYQEPPERGATHLILRNPPSEQDKEIELRQKEWYWPGYFPAQVGKQPYLRSGQAIRVNEILSLYEDRVPWDFGPMLDRGTRAFHDYLAAYQVFHPTNSAEDEKIWSDIAPGLKKDADTNLVAAYKLLLVANPERKEGFVRLSTNLKTLLQAKLDEQYGTGAGANALFDHLNHQEFVAEDADKLFDSRTNQSAQVFIQRVGEVSGAFLDARMAMRELLLMALEGHALATETGPGTLEFRNTRTGRTIARTAGELVAACIQPVDITSLTNHPAANGRILVLAGQLPKAEKCRWQTNDYKLAANVIAGELAKQGAVLSRSILALDSALAQSGEIEHRYGLARGPTASAAAIFPSEELRRSLRDLQGALNGAFGGGRPESGMETLIEDYLKAARTNYWFETRSQSSEFTLLLDSLVAFGQKVVTLGNTAVLVNSGNDPEVRKYIAVLQYVGNAILVHTDELKHRASHADCLKKQATLTATALREAGFTNSVLTNTAQLKLMDAKDLLAHLLENIRAQRINALLNPATNGEVSNGPPDKFVAAIDRVIEMKNNNIYLRPASAYLRSSYPATTLNVNESIGWGNQLEREAWRSVPLIGELLESGSRARLKELRELDKQSWQNINRVRVAGAGRVNNVIAKDDIGNWYVKSYSADPTNIIKSTRNLAMFSAGNAFGSRLSIIGPDSQNLVATNSPFSPQFDRAATNYLTQTLNNWSTLTNKLLGTEFTNGVPALWPDAGVVYTNFDRLTTNALSAGALKGYQKAIADSSSNIAAVTGVALDRARIADTEILNVLYSIKRYHATVQPKLNLEGATDEAAKARSAFTRYVRDFLDDRIAERASALDRFEAAIEIIQSADAK